MSNQIDDQIKELAGGVMMARANTVYLEEMLNICGSEGSQFDAQERVRRVLEAIVAESYISAASETQGRFKAALFDEIFATQTWGFQR